MENYTTDDLIQYLYQEKSDEEMKAIEAALQKDWDLNEQFKSLKEAKQGLNKLVVSPRQQSVTAILDYARISTEIAQP